MATTATQLGDATATATMAAMEGATATAMAMTAMATRWQQGQWQWGRDGNSNSNSGNGWRGGSSNGRHDDNVTAALATAMEGVGQCHHGFQKGG